MLIRTLLLLNLSFCLTASSLKEAFKDKFHIGSAINIQEQLIQHPEKFEALIKKEFNSLVAENAMKWEAINPQKGIYDFKFVDTLVNFAQKNNMQVVGHVLFWHNQNPDWLFKDDQGETVSKDELLKRMRFHLTTLHKRYGNKIQSWDVVNEAINEDGSVKDSPWKKILGDDWILQAFQMAQEVFPPSTKLIYNDFNVFNKKKLAGITSMVDLLLAAGIRIDAIGVQAHWALDYPSDKSIENLINQISSRGLKIDISELDIDVLPMPKSFSGGAEITENHSYKQSMDPYRKEFPKAKQEELAARYANIFRIFLKHADKIDRVNFWGLNDEFTWKNQWPIANRKNHPLLFDRNNDPKPAYFRILQSPSIQSKGVTK